MRQLADVVLKRRHVHRHVLGRQLLLVLLRRRRAVAALLLLPAQQAAEPGRAQLRAPGRRRAARLVKHGLDASDDLRLLRRLAVLRVA